MNAFVLYKKHDMESLVEMLRVVSMMPENQLPDGSLYLLKLPARKQTDAITRAISWHMDDKREATNP